LYSIPKGIRKHEEQATYMISQRSSTAQQNLPHATCVKGRSVDRY
jgi:hypothetical protein